MDKTRALKASVAISPNALRGLPAGRKTLTVTYFSNWDKTEVVIEFREYGSDAKVLTEIISGIISIRIKVNESTYPVPLDFQLKTKKSNTSMSSTVMKETYCSFWDEKTSTFSTSGLSKVKEDDSSISCHSEHTTSFAILLQVTELPTQISHNDYKILDMLTNILSCVSISALLITIGIFMMFRTLRTAERNIIHTNLAVSLLAAQVLFLIGVDLSGNKLTCTIIALTLHYLYLAVFGWMLVEGLDLFYKIVKVYGSEQNRLPIYLGIGWGIPIPIVIVSAGIRFNSYTAISSCWLNMTNGVIWAFAGPACIVILINSVLLVIIGRIIYRSSSAVNNMNNTTGLRASLRGVLILTPLLGSTWIFGLLAIGDAAVIFQYLFVIFSSLQGFFIFMIYCLF
ncbi:adhesion G-protein coupled receptor D1-like [Amphiura filiformis]|uniref:adhesion G-protein coupled receptor D1-like n=1 Tax=Amphiura filiformis TaxID=82378 RepID=UPI003B2289F0